MHESPDLFDPVILSAHNEKVSVVAVQGHHAVTEESVGKLGKVVEVDAVLGDLRCLKAAATRPAPRNEEAKFFVLCPCAEVPFLVHSERKRGADHIAYSDPIGKLEQCHCKQLGR